MLRPGDLVRCRFPLCPGTPPLENAVLTVMSVTPHDDPRYCLTCVSFASSTELLAYEFSNAQLGDVVGSSCGHLELLA